MPKRTKKTIAIRQTAPRPIGLYMMYLSGGEHLTELTAKVLPKIENPFEELWHKLEDQRKEHSTQSFLEGVKRYREFDWQRPQPKYEKVTFYNRATLLRKGCIQGAPVLVIPSMVNRGYILDLLPDYSLLNHLKDEGFTVYQLDWLDPIVTDDSSQTSLDEAIENIIAAAIDEIYALHNEKVHLAGYCMGGTLAVAAATLRQECLASLSLIAAPWDFSKQPYAPFLETSKTWSNFFLKNAKMVPIDVIQGFFVLQDPLSAIQRLTAYAQIEDEEQLKRMTAIEDWLADGVALESNIALDVYQHWFLNNKPHEGRWWINSHLISPGRLEIPTHIITASKDSVVPTAGSTGLLEQIPNTTHTEVDAGHIGLMVGRKAKQAFFTPWAKWLKEIK